VGVEKVPFPEIRPKLGDQKCLRGRRSSFKGHPSASVFWRNLCERVFQHPRLFTPTIRQLCYQMLIVKILTAVAVVLCFLTWCEAGNEIVEYAKVRDVGSLAGVVSDPVGAPIAEVRTCEMSGDWKTELACTTTDAQGHWALPSVTQSNVHQIQFVKDGFNQVRVRVRLKRNAKPLTIDMPVAT